MKIQIKNLTKRYRHKTILKDINLEFSSGELVAVLGPSGSGKTTLLRTIAGLEDFSYGNIYFDNVEVSKLKNMSEIGFVFQHYALFNNMNVFDNISFGLRMMPKKNRLSKNQITERVNELLKLIHLENLVHNYPDELSGGQRQRVALARTLAMTPRLLLLDEPFGALDLKIRRDLRRWLRGLHKKLNITTIFVTHDQEEALEVADKVVIMREGIIEQVDKPAKLYQNPANSFVYDFLGEYNKFVGVLNHNNVVSVVDNQSIMKDFTKQKWFHQNRFVHKIFKLIRLEKEDLDTKNQQKHEFVEIFVRPHDMEVVSKPLPRKEYIKAKFVYLNAVGPVYKLELERSDGSIIIAQMVKDEFEIKSFKLNDELFVRPREFTVFE